VSYIKAETLKRFENMRFVIICYEYFEILLRFVRFEVITAVMSMLFFWDVMPYGLVTFKKNNIGYTGHKVSVSLSYVTVRGEWKMERTRGEQDTFCDISCPPSLAGHQHVYF
jgi:hypothetical protein